MREYKDLLHHVLEYGHDREDRTGVGTRSVFGAQIRVSSIFRGFPLLTTKKVHFKSIVHELIWFLSGDTNVKYLQDNGVKIWDAWSTKEECAKFGREEGDLGQVYPKQWNSFGSWDVTRVVRVPKRVPSKRSMTPVREGAGKPKGPFEVLETDVRRGTSRYPYDRIRFLDTGYEYEVRRSQIDEGTVRDPYAATVAGVGYLGEYKKHPLHRHLHAVWTSMLERCYSPKCKEYKYYGAKGVTVATRWHCYAAFLDDVTRLPGWYEKSQNPAGYELDKDHLGGDIYSPETCIWAPSFVNKSYMRSTAFEAVSPDGAVYRHISPKIFAELHGLNVNCVSKAVRGEQKHHRGWTFRRVDDPDLRFVAPVNQIDRVIESIKTNPYSRRHIVTGWNPLEADQVALPPCHTLFQFYVREDKYLDCHLYQRSGDIFLGVPFNIASYALLTSMIAALTGLEAGDLICSYGDLHLYSNHFDQAREQLSRRPRALPTLKLNTEGVEHITDFTYDHIKIENYNPHPAIKAPVAV